MSLFVLLNEEYFINLFLILGSRDMMFDCFSLRFFRFLVNGGILLGVLFKVVD